MPMKYEDREYYRGGTERDNDTPRAEQIRRDAEKGKRRYFMFSAVWKWVLLAAIVIYSVITLIAQQSKIDSQMKTNEELSEKVEELKEQVAALKEDLYYMGTDEYVERVARERLGMYKDGEIIFKEAGKAAPSGSDAGKEGNDGYEQP